MERRAVRIGALALGMLGSTAGLLACMTDEVGVSTSFDPLSSFPAQATYVWDAQGISLPDDPRIDAEGVDREIRKAARESFAARGYRETTGSAQYRLAYQLGVDTWTGPDRSAAVGSLSVELLEMDTRRKLWTGYARADIHVGLEEAERHARLRRIFDRMLADFPPSQRGGL